MKLTLTPRPPSAIIKKRAVILSTSTDYRFGPPSPGGPDRRLGSPPVSVAPRSPSTPSTACRLANLALLSLCFAGEAPLKLGCEAGRDLKAAGEGPTQKPPAGWQNRRAT